MYSLAAQCIFIKIQILGEPGRNIMKDLFQTINILQIMVLFLDLNHSNADVTTQLIVFQKMAMKLFFNMTTKRAKHPSHYHTQKQLASAFLQKYKHPSLTLKLHQFLIDFGGYFSNILLLLKPQVKQPHM